MSKINDISYIGIDIAKSKFDVCVFNGNYANCVYNSYTNNLDGFYELFCLLESVNNLDSIRIGFEATSTYMNNLQKYLDNHKIKYILINPMRLKHFIKYKHSNNKTDKMDSYYISDFISNLPDTSFNSSFNKTRTLYRSYSAYINLIVKTETHIKALKDSVLNDDFISDTLKTEILSFDENLRKTKKKALNELLEVSRISMPEYDFIKSDLIGVGDKTLLAVLPFIYDISEKYTIKQLQNYIGLNPVFTDSGTSVHKAQRISKQGNKEARKMLYMSALASIRRERGNPFLIDKYNRLIKNGKPTKVALVAISAHVFRAIVTKLNYYKGVLRND